MSADEITADQLIGEEMANILRGLNLSLLSDLVLLDGETLEELTIDLQEMPFGDKAVLYAYGCVTKSPRGRYTALPKLVRLTRAAHVVKDHLSQVTGADMSKYLDEK